MQYEIELRINTPINYFERRLNAFRNRYFFGSIPIDETHYLSIINQPTLRYENDGEYLHEIEAAIITITGDQDDVKAEIQSQFTTILYIIITELSPNRLIVKIRFNQRLILENVISMLAEMKKDFPEAETEIREFIDENQPVQKENTETEETLLAKIPDRLWYREAVRLWREGFTAPDIGKQVKRSRRTVTNKLSELRRNFGEDVVPYRKDT